jgi:hypothetical protein
MSGRAKRWLIYGSICAVVLLALALTIACVYSQNPTIVLVVGVLVLCFMGLVLLGIGVSYLYDFVQCLFWPRGVTRRDDRGVVVEVRLRREMATRIDTRRERLNRVWASMLEDHVLRVPMRRFNVALLSTFLILGGFVVAATVFNVSALWFVLPIVGLPLGLYTSRVGRLLCVYLDSVVVLSAGHCASCGYELAQLPPEDDGCTVCPECGAAWRLTICPECGHGFEDVLPDACPECEWRRASASAAHVPVEAPAVEDRG